MKPNRFEKTGNEGYFNDLSEKTKELVKELILEAAQYREGPEGFKHDKECLADIECERRGGFIPFDTNRGGINYNNFSDLIEYHGGCYKCAHHEADKEIARQIEVSREFAIDAWTENKGKKPTKKQQRSEEFYEYFDENLRGDDSSIMHNFCFLYHGKSDKMHSASVSAAINTEGPYHRTHIAWASNVFCEGSKEVEITWTSDRELKTKLKAALAECSKAIF